MKPYLLLCVGLLGCSSVTQTLAEKPSGEELFDVLLNSSDLLLAGEPLCDVTSFTRGGKDITLGQHLATNLSISYETSNPVRVKSSCLPSKHELAVGDVVDVWDCRIEVLETGQQDEFISSSMIVFSMNLEKTAVIRGSIRCL